jgi:branched-chain amino acid transport system ATP-binding protein
VTDVAELVPGFDQPPAQRGARLQGVGITRRYGGLVAVDRMDIVAEPARVTALIGPNGAGKTTLFNCLTGVDKPDAGQVLLNERDITRLPTEERATLGVARTFQRLAVFPTMTAADNLRVGAESRRPGSIFRGLCGLPEPTRVEDAAQVERLLRLLGLQEVRDVPAGTLPTGTLRLVELGRALCLDPRVLLLDEPASGLDSNETEHLQDVLRAVARQGVAVLLVEHDVDLVFRVADLVYAMAEGALIAMGDPEFVRSHPAVRAAYLDSG